MAFADVGDTVWVTHADRLSVTATGPFATALGSGEDNLIHRALLELGHVAGTGAPSLAVTLDKALPVAAGLGGGSSDAGAALKLATVAMGLDLTEARLADISRVVGADGPMCLAARSAWADGTGDRLEFAPELPPLHAVLANPGRPSPTGAVYRAYDAAPVGEADRPQPPPDWSPATIIGWLARQRNDLEAPALALEPAIGLALSAVRAAGARLTRMSGSGATVFGLFESAEEARAAAETVSRAQGDWWVRPTILSGKA